MRNQVLFFICATFLCACNNHEQGKSSAPSANQQLITQFFSHFNQHDWSKMASMYKDTAAFKDPSFGIGIVKQTRQQVIDKYAELQKIFPDLHDEVLQIYEQGDKHIVVEFMSSGTRPDGAKFQLPICTIFTIENGLITQDFTYYDNFEEAK
ncbi:MAG: hypothetical protein RL660_1551 [Bacteroidota bacterium]|jgi:ketosteroid isomerase-like protein